MDEVFLKILNMSLSSVWIVLAVVLVRAVFRYAPEKAPTRRAAPISSAMVPRSMFIRTSSCFS